MMMRALWLISIAIKTHLIFVTFLALSMTSCNVIHWKKSRIESKLTDAGFERRIEPLGDAAIEYWIGGSGPDLLLLHGFGASAIWQWVDQMDLYVRDYRVIVPNLLWFGASHSKKNDFTLDHQLQIVLALLDHLDSKRSHVIGLSYGGFVTYELAARHPDRVDKIVISDSPARTFRFEDYESACARMNVEKLSDLLVPTDVKGVDLLMELGYYSPPWAPRFAKRQVVTTLYSRYPKQQRALLDTMIDNWPADDGTTPKAPSLLIWGEHDTLFPLSLAKRLQKRLGQRTRLETIPKARHAPHLEHPEKFNRLVLEFLE